MGKRRAEFPMKLESSKVHYLNSIIPFYVVVGPAKDREVLEVKKCSRKYFYFGENEETDWDKYSYTYIKDYNNKYFQYYMTFEEAERSIVLDKAKYFKDNRERITREYSEMSEFYEKYPELRIAL